jgi:protocatechuate 3,4-dioxygenase beta subunit
MKMKRLLILIFLGLVTLSVYFLTLLKSGKNTEIVKEEDVSGNCTPAFRDGGGPYYLPNSPFREKIAPDANKGEVLIVTGKILRSDCVTPASGAVLDIWQANETGNYEDDWYRGRIQSDDSGNYKFETVIPEGYGEGTGYRPPHIHFKVFIDGKEILTSQMFFPEIKGTEGFNDAFIMNVESTNEDGNNIHKGRHDIILP